MKQIKTIEESTEALVGMNPGDIWTEYHWRLVLQIKQEFQAIKERIQEVEDMPYLGPGIE